MVTELIDMMRMTQGRIKMWQRAAIAAEAKGNAKAMHDALERVKIEKAKLQELKEAV